MTKIAFIASNEYVPWGGSEYLWGGAAEKLTRRGVHVSVSVKDWGKPVKQVEHLRAAGCRIFKRPVPSLARRAARKLPPWRDYARRHVQQVGAGADLIVVSQGSMSDGLLWMKVAHSLGIPYCLICEGVAETWWPDDDLAEALAGVYENARAAFFVSEDNVYLTRQQLVTPLPRARVVRNPFNVRYDAGPPWPNDNAGLSLAFVSRLEISGKGHNLLFEVLRLPRWRDRDIRVSLYGDGPNERALRRLAQGFGLSNVEFCGSVTDIEKVWAAHHAFLLPSRHEGMPLALVEAMLCARPAIATDVGGVRELLRDNVNGFLVKAPTVELLDEAMNRAWENRHRLHEMGQQAALDARKFVGPDPVEDFVRDLLTLVDPDAGRAIQSPAPASRTPSLATEKSP